VNDFFVDPRAEQDFLEAVSWYAERSDSAGKALADAVDGAFADIAAAPTRWPILDDIFRGRIVDRFPYLIVYRLRSESIVIVAVAHTSRAVYWRDR
jgi:toxin ParE1/3/4